MIHAALLAAAALSAEAWALDGNDRLRLELEGGAHAEGYFYRYEGGQILLSGDGQLYAVQLGAVTRASRAGAPLPLPQLHDELVAAAALEAARAAGPAPSPVGVALASAAWAGAGPAALGQRRQFWAYTSAELVLLGGAAYGAVGLRSPGVTVPLLGVDLLLHVVAARDSRAKAEAIRRRQRDPRARAAAHALPIVQVGPSATGPADPAEGRAAPPGSDAPDPDTYTPSSK